jgi:type IV pilus assembly protein PilQ
MIRGMTLVTTTLFALGLSVTAARPASATPDAATRGARAVTAPTDPRPGTELPAPTASVISLSVVPTADRSDVIIGVDGAVEVQDFTLHGPDKIVVDITGADLGMPSNDTYDRIARAGIIDVRYSQYRRNVVRVVLTLDSTRPYSVVRGKHEVRVLVEGPSKRLDPWHIGYDVPSSTVADRASRTEIVEGRSPTAKVSEPRGEPTVGFSKFVAMQQRTQQPRITIAWENADIHDVLAAFAAFSGRTIIPAREVTGNITAEISNQPWDVAMRAILNANGFDAVEDQNGIIIVDTFNHLISRQNAEPLNTRTIRLNYARSNSVAGMVKERLSRDCSRITVGGAAPTPTLPNGTPAIQLNPNCPIRGAVTSDSLTNSLSITDIPANLEELEAYARSVDLRQPQVNIKAKIILVDRTNLEGLGLRYDLGGQTQFFNDLVQRTNTTGSVDASGSQISLGGNMISAIANATARVPSAALQLVYSTAIGNFDFTSFLEALEQVSLLDVQAEPSASVLNNRTANLTAGTQVPIRVIDASSGGSQNGAFPQATVRIQETGVILNVTPQVTANGQIQMRVHVENSDVQDLGGDIGPVFPRQSVDNEVLVNDGETAVMGGLTQTSIRIAKTGIPLLVDLPLIGKLFGVTNRTETKRDLLILITPHIIDDGQQPPSDQNRR